MVRLSNEELYIVSNCSKLVQQGHTQNAICTMKTTYLWVYTQADNPSCPIPFCVVYGKQLHKCSNGSTNIQRTLNYKLQPIDKLKVLLNLKTDIIKLLFLKITYYEKAEIASYIVAELTDHKRDSHPIAENPIRPECKIMLNKKLM